MTYTGNSSHTMHSSQFTIPDSSGDSQVLKNLKLQFDGSYPISFSWTDFSLPNPQPGY